MRLLLVEDDKGVASFIHKGLTESGYTVDIAWDGEEGAFLSSTQTYDLIILDVMLPGMDGFQIIKQIRGNHSDTPVIFLTARDDRTDIVKGLNLGADDYMVKPFGFAELLARIQAVLRRGGGKIDSSEVTIDDLHLDRVKRIAIRDNTLIELSTKEFQLLEYLMLNTDLVLTRTMIREHVWGYNFDTASNIIDVHINRLRNKIDKGHKTKLIHTIKGAGYALKTPDSIP